MSEYKGLNADQVELLVNYLNRNINKHRNSAEAYESTGNMTLSMFEYSRAAELDYALAYLLGLMHGE